MTSRSRRPGTSQGRKPGVDRPAPAGRQKAVGFGFVVLLSFLAGMTDAIGFLRAGDFLSFMSGNTTRLAIAMGMLNAAVDTVAGNPVGLTYVTGALSRFGKGLGRFLCGERRGGFLVQMLPWIGMLTGAVTGVFLLQAWQEAAIWAIGATALLLTLVSVLVPHGWMLPCFGLGRP